MVIVWLFLQARALAAGPAQRAESPPAPPPPPPPSFDILPAPSPPSAAASSAAAAAKQTVPTNVTADAVESAFSYIGFWSPSSCFVLLSLVYVLFDFV